MFRRYDSDYMGKLKKPPAILKPSTPGRPWSPLDTRVICYGDNLEQLAKLPDQCISPIDIDPPFNSIRNYEVCWGMTKEDRALEDRHASTQAYIHYMRPRQDETSSRTFTI